MSASTKIICASVLIGLGCLIVILRSDSSSEPPRSTPDQAAEVPAGNGSSAASSNSSSGKEQVASPEAPGRVFPSLPSRQGAREARSVFEGEARDARWAASRERSLEIAVAKHLDPESKVKSMVCRRSVCALELGGNKVVELVEALSEDPAVTAESRSFALSRHEPTSSGDETPTIVVFLTYDR